MKLKFLSMIFSLLLTSQMFSATHYNSNSSFIGIDAPREEHYVNDSGIH